MSLEIFVLKISYFNFATLQFVDLESAVQAFKGTQNQGAFKYIYERLSKKLFAICLRYIVNTAEAQDVMQETFILIFHKINDYSNTGSFEGWAKRITVNNCLQKLRSNKNFIQQLENLEDYEQMGDAEADDLLFNPSELKILFNELPHKYKVVLSLFAIDQLSHKEVGLQLGINENASRILLLRAKAALKSKILNHVTK